MTAIHGSRGQLLTTSTPNTAISNLELTNTGDNLTYRTPTGEQAKRYWDRTATFVFQQSSNGSSWNTVTPSSVQYVGGRVTFASAVGGTNQARISSGAYLPYAAIGDILNYGFDLERDEHDTTSFTTTGTPTRNRTFIPGLAGGTFKISKFLVDATFANYLTVFTADTLIASIVLDVTAGTQLRLESYGWITGESSDTTIDDLIMEDLEFRIDGKFYFNS